MDVRAVIAVSTADVPVFGCLLGALKPGFHIVVSVVSVVSIVRKKFIGHITLWKPPVQMLNTKETTDTTCCTR